MKAKLNLVTTTTTTKIEIQMQSRRSDSTMIGCTLLKNNH